MVSGLFNENMGQESLVLFHNKVLSTFLKTWQ